MLTLKKSCLGAFISGFLIMSIEILSPRALSPYFGSSIEVWSIVIGLTLLAIAIGYHIGGEILPSTSGSKISIFFAATAVLLLSTSVLCPFLSAWIASFIPNNNIACFICFLILFAPGLALLGAVMPFFYSLSFSEISLARKTSGALGVSSAAGSFIGVLITGCFLLYYFSTTSLLIFQSLCCLLAAAVFAKIPRSFYIFLPLLAAPLIIGKNSAAIRIETPYSIFNITEQFSRDGRRMRELRNGPCGIQSAMFLDKSEDKFDPLIDRLKAGENRYPLEVLSFFDNYRILGKSKEKIRVLMLGGGAFIYPTELIKRPEISSVDVVELDSGLIPIAQRYFNLVQHPELKIHLSDARVFINGNHRLYDLVIFDVFSSACSLPAHVLTQQSLKKLRDNLNPDSIIITNVIASLSSKGNQALRALYMTFKESFNTVFVAAVDNPVDPEMTQNFVIYAANFTPAINISAPEGLRFQQHLIPQERLSGGVLLTDNYSPLDWLAENFG